MILPSLLLAAAAAPEPADLALFGDWTVGCDNGRACQAVGLMPESWPDDAATMIVRRGPEPGAAPAISFDIEAGAGAGLEADGRRLRARLAGGASEGAVPPADVPEVIAALRSANQLRIVGDGKTLGTVSLKGASAALLYIDDRQHRAGTVTALVRIGPKPATAMPPPPALPVVKAAPLTNAAPLALGAARIEALRKQQGCTIDEVGGPDSVETAALSPTQTLVLLACGSGAYNVSMVPFVAEQRGGDVRIALAPFDVKIDWWEDGKPILVNADWDTATGLLGSFSKGRGLGECGVTASYAWDSARFRLVEQAEMGECRGSTDYITTWRARVVRP